MFKNNYSHDCLKVYFCVITYDSPVLYILGLYLYSSASKKSTNLINFKIKISQLLYLIKIISTYFEVIPKKKCCVFLRLVERDASSLWVLNDLPHCWQKYKEFWCWVTLLICWHYEYTFSQYCWTLLQGFVWRCPCLLQ